MHAVFCEQSFVKNRAINVHLTYCTYKDDVDRFQNVSVLEFYCWKACRINKVHARFHEIANEPFTSTNYENTKAPSTLICFQTKTELFCSGIRLSSTLQRRKWSPKTEPFENALQSGECVDAENDDILKRWRHQKRHEYRPWVSKMADRRYHVASLLIAVVVWMGENDAKTISVDANLFENGANQFRFCLKTD